MFVTGGILGNLCCTMRSYRVYGAALFKLVFQIVGLKLVVVS